MQVPFIDLDAQQKLIRENVNLALGRVIDSTAFASGPFVRTFEKEFANFCGANYCVAVNSGTSALHLSLLAHGVKAGDEVITVPNSFIATAWAITYCGAKPVFVDVDPNTWLMDPDLIEQVITPNTKVILPVHLYGQPVDIDPVNEVAAQYGLAVIEDAAQAHAATYVGEKIGNTGNTTCFSFYPGKNLGAYGEGGAVVTPREDIAKKINMLRDHGQSKKYHHDVVGFNYRMDGLQGAVLSIKLRDLHKWTNDRNNAANEYKRRLSEVPGIQLPHIRENATSAFHLYVVLSKERNELASYLGKQGVSTGLHYPIPIHLQEAYRNLGHRLGDFPHAELNAERCLSLPMYSELSANQIEYVCEHIIRFCQ